jgi:hypothetical protein
MAQLQTHSPNDLCNEDGTRDIKPGNFVRHTEDPRNSFGTCLSRREADGKTVCEVLWSKQPHLIQIQSTPIQAQSRKLAAKWSTQQSEDIGTYNGFIGKTPGSGPMYEVEEEYEYMDYSEVQRLHTEGADVQLHVDGRVTVKRKTDQPPEHLGPNDRIMRSSVRFGVRY